ncbi:transglutaminaseTgpA domain-containing protein [Shewanella sp. A32]|uniref:transglutaminase family protein n=1 Tax=Shewanella sp. A32 TaxID=3031327 RepID=UPI0023B9C919|nr:transglutaminaseTgpA domain-containing protein [Shewanella sp. A32]MDF0534425.1 transglutaminaseTgpA domain-containing protein [Shewanella sp. A32]
MNSSEHLSRRTLLWLLLTNIAVLLPLHDKITVASLGICGICFVWRLGIYLGKVARPPRWLVTVLAVASAATLALVSRELGLLNTLINLLILGYALKYIEARRRRDVLAIILAGYFLIALTFIDHQGIGNVLLLLPVTAINTLTLVSLFRENCSPATQSWLTIKLLLQSIPLTLLLFIVVPRFAPLWMVPQMKSASTGLSDEVGFGDISQLTRSSELTFRATFDGAVPKPAERYWRAIVLDDYDGKHWRQSSAIKTLQSRVNHLLPERTLPVERDNRRNYKVIAEPSGQHWLFAMGNAFSNTPGVFSMPDYRLYASRSLEQKFQYQVTQYPNAPLQEQLSETEYQRNLTLPAQINPRTRALAQQFTLRYPQALPRLNAMMQYFRQQPFFYTLTPPATGPQQLDDFLFETRAGFCVHYASAFTFMARASGLPARLVTGYQGGEFNPEAGYLSVYQYMAHAWSEVWLPNRGWSRFDPTAMIAPQRIMDGFDAMFAPQDSYLANTTFPAIRASAWFNQLRMQFASLDYYWTVWVLGFDNDRQQQVLNQLLGEVTATRIALLVLGVMTAVFTIIGYSAGLLYLPQRRSQLDRDFSSICRVAARKGIVRPIGCGPVDFITLLTKHWPALHQPLIVWGDLYLQLKYAELTTKKQRKLSRQFHRQSHKLWLALLRTTPELKERTPQTGTI